QARPDPVGCTVAPTKRAKSVARRVSCANRYSSIEPLAAPKKCGASLPAVARCVNRRGVPAGVVRGIVFGVGARQRGVAHRPPDADPPPRRTLPGTAPDAH